MPRDAQPIETPAERADRLALTLLEIYAEAVRCNQAHRDVPPSFLLQRLRPLAEESGAGAKLVKERPE